MDIIAERGLPHSVDAEACVLGSIMLENDSIFEVRDFLHPNDFYLECNRLIYEEMLSMLDVGVGVDTILLKNRLAEKDMLDIVGGVMYLSQLIDTVPTARNIYHYASVVKKEATKRQIILASYDAIDQIYKGEKDPDEILDITQSSLQRITHAANNQLHHIEHIIADRIDYYKHRLETGNKNKIKSGIRQLDNLIDCFFEENLTIIAGRPSQGKTALLKTIIQNVAFKDPVLFFSIEQTAGEMADRLVSGVSRLDSRLLRSLKLTPSEWREYYATAAKVGGMKLWIDDGALRTLRQIQAISKRYKVMHNIKAIFIDYLTRIKHHPIKGVRMERWQLVGEISTGLKDLAKELKVPVIASAQLHRIDEHVEPGLDNLRESGNIEQDADLVIFLWTMLDENRRGLDGKPKEQSVATVAKQRDGATGRVPLYFAKKYTNFYGLAEDEIGAKPW